MRGAAKRRAAFSQVETDLEGDGGRARHAAAREDRQRREDERGGGRRGAGCRYRARRQTRGAAARGRRYGPGTAASPGGRSVARSVAGSAATASARKASTDFGEGDSSHSQRTQTNPA